MNLTDVLPTWKAGDTLPPLSGCCYSADTPLDGSTVSAVAHVALGGAVLVRPVTIAADGTWSMTWQPGDLTPGVGFVEVQVTFAGGGIQTFGSATFEVKSQIA